MYHVPADIGSQNNFRKLGRERSTKKTYAYVLLRILNGIYSDSLHRLFPGVYQARLSLLVNIASVLKLCRGDLLHHHNVLHVEDDSVDDIE